MDLICHLGTYCPLGHFVPGTFCLNPRRDAHCRVWLWRMMHTAESDFVVGCTLWIFFENFYHLTPRCDAHHCMEFDSKVGCTLWNLTLGYDAHRRVWLCGMMHTSDSDSIVGCTRQILLKFEYLGEIETAFENNLSCLSVELPVKLYHSWSTKNLVSVLLWLFVYPDGFKWSSKISWHCL